MADETTPSPRPIVPKELAGMWIAWNSAGTSIIANGCSLADVQRMAKNLGEASPSFEKTPQAARIIRAAKVSFQGRPSD